MTDARDLTHKVLHELHDELTTARRPDGFEEVEIDQVDQSAAAGCIILIWMMLPEVAGL